MRDSVVRKDEGHLPGGREYRVHSGCPFLDAPGPGHAGDHRVGATRVTCHRLFHGHMGSGRETMQHSEPSLPDQAVGVADAIPLPADLPAAFQGAAAIVRKYAADERAAAIWERAAEMAKQSLRRSGLERLKLPQAALESDYTRDHLRRLIDDGKIPNASVADGSKAILRMHLPRKPGHGLAPVRSTVASSRLQAARAVAGREK